VLNPGVARRQSGDQFDVLKVKAEMFMIGRQKPFRRYGSAS
jgi:hypothetical protein